MRRNSGSRRATIRANKLGHISSGMWKIAYADFVTAMMAFFILLWVLNSTPKENLTGIAQYFAPHAAKDNLALKNNHAHIAEQPKNFITKVQDQQHFLSVMSALNNDPALKRFSDNLDIVLVDDGLLIQIIDNERRPMFLPNTTQIQPYMKEILYNIALLVKDLPNYISIAGHTTALRNPASSNIDLWDLSIRRAKIVRDYLVTNLLSDEQIISITGKADREPYDPHDIYSTKNIRISVKLLNSTEVSKYQRSIPSL